MSDFLNMLRGRGLLSDIDVAFARFLGRNAGGDPALTLLAALVSNAASVHGEIALPAEKIASRDLIRAVAKQGTASVEDLSSPPRNTYSGGGIFLRSFLRSFLNNVVKKSKKRLAFFAAW